MLKYTYPHSKAEKQKSNKQTNEVITRWSTRTHSINNSTTEENERHGHNHTTRVAGGEKYVQLSFNARGTAVFKASKLWYRGGIFREHRGEGLGTGDKQPLIFFPQLKLGNSASHFFTHAHQDLSPRKPSKGLAQSTSFCYCLEQTSEKFGCFIHYMPCAHDCLSTPVANFLTASSLTRDHTVDLHLTFVAVSSAWVNCTRP